MYQASGTLPWGLGGRGGLEPAPGLPRASRA